MDNDYDIQIDIYKDQLFSCENKLLLYKNQILNLQRKILELEKKQKRFSWSSIWQTIKCMLGFHEWEYGYDFQTQQYNLLYKPYYKERRCLHCAEHQLRRELPPDGDLGNWYSI